MPCYDWFCVVCQKEEEHYVSSDKRDNPRFCIQCGSIMKRQFPVEAIFGFQPFQEYFDESLGVDITGREHRQQVMKVLGVHEAGDRVGGAINYDTKAPNQVKPLPPRGIPLKEKENPEKLLEEEMLTIHEKDGTEHSVKLSELKVL